MLHVFCVPRTNNNNNHNNNNINKILIERSYLISARLTSMRITNIIIKYEDHTSKLTKYKK